MLLLVAVFMPFAGLIALIGSGRAMLAGARANDDGTKVEVSRADHRFAEQLAALLAHAGAQQGYGQPVYAQRPHPHQHSG